MRATGGEPQGRRYILQKRHGHFRESNLFRGKTVVARFMKEGVVGSEALQSTRA
jgi:hypothetical protein